MTTESKPLPGDPMTPDHAAAAIFIVLALTIMAVDTARRVMAWAEADVARMVAEALDDALDVEDEEANHGAYFVQPPASLYVECDWSWADAAVNLCREQGWPDPAWPDAGDFEQDALAEIDHLTGDGS